MSTSACYLSKSAFLDRVSRRAAERYGQTVDAGWLADLIDAGLISKAKRSGNDGKKPVYVHDAADYRRALQIVRLRARCVVGRDAVRLILYINQYGMSACCARSALLQEWPKHGKAMLAQVRSGYVDNRRLVPPKHKESLARQFGPLDDRIAGTGFKLDLDMQDSLARDAVQSPMPSGPVDAPTQLLELFASGRLAVRALGETVAPLLRGLLMFDPDATSDDDSADYFEGLVTAATPDELDNAAKLAALSQRRLRARMFAKLGIITDDQASITLDNAIHYSVQRSAAWASILLLAALIMVRLVQEMPTADQIVEMKAILEGGEFDWSKLNSTDLRILKLFDASRT